MPTDRPYFFAVLPVDLVSANVLYLHHFKQNEVYAVHQKFPIYICLICLVLSYNKLFFGLLFMLFCTCFHFTYFSHRCFWHWYSTIPINYPSDFFLVNCDSLMSRYYFSSACYSTKSQIIDLLHVNKFILTEMVSIFLVYTDNCINCRNNLLTVINYSNVK